MLHALLDKTGPFLRELRRELALIRHDFDDHFFRDKRRRIELEAELKRMAQWDPCFAGDEVGIAYMGSRPVLFNQTLLIKGVSLAMEVKLGKKVLCDPPIPEQIGAEPAPAPPRDRPENPFAPCGLDLSEFGFNPAGRIDGAYLRAIRESSKRDERRLAYDGPKEYGEAVATAKAKYDAKEKANWDSAISWMERRFKVKRSDFPAFRERVESVTETVLDQFEVAQQVSSPADSPA